MKDSAQFHDFYQNHLQQFGASAQGVGWKNEEAQVVRFRKLYALLSYEENASFSVNDLGCGVGDFVSFLSLYKGDFHYSGYDVMPEMIEKAKTTYQDLSHVHFHSVSNAAEMKMADYTIASGIFNIRFEATDKAWLTYILETLKVMNERSQKGFAFNVLSMYSDVEYRKRELYYADPTYLFDHCKKSFSKNVALLHDYNQYDFTLIVRK